MHHDFDKAAKSFAANAAEVERLLDFDRLIIDVAVDGLKHVERELEKRNLHSVIGVVQGRATILLNVKTSDSLRPQFEAMFNQCVVLLVSYFGSAVHTLFRQGVRAALSVGAPVPAAHEELKVSWKAVAQAEGDRQAMFADLLIAQHNISFQDMQSISRAFKNQLGIEIVRSGNTNDIVLGQAARHVIVHAAGIVDQRMVDQVARVKPRSLKASLEPGMPIRFAPSEVRTLSASMVQYVAEVSEALTAACAAWCAVGSQPPPQSV